MAINGRAAEFSVCVAKSTYRYIIHGTGFNPEDTKTFLGRGVTLLLDPAIGLSTRRAMTRLIRMGVPPKRLWNKVASRNINQL